MFIHQTVRRNRSEFKINLALSNVTLNEAIKAVEQNTKYVFFYNNSEIDLDKRISLNAKNATIESVMTQILPDNEYRVENDKIIIFSKSRQSKCKVTGIITDDRGEAVVGANIMEKGTNNGTIAAIDGSFSLEVSPNAVLRVTSIGYKPQEVKVSNNNSFKITLIEDSELLDEVVVVGYGTQKKSESYRFSSCCRFHGYQY